MHKLHNAAAWQKSEILLINLFKLQPKPFSDSLSVTNQHPFSCDKDPDERED